MRILSLTGSHDRRSFECGRPELDDWLQRIARQHQEKGLSKTFVATRDRAPSRICGFYALTLIELRHHHLPPAWGKRLPNRVPGVKLGRLAVARELQGKGLGQLLLIDAVRRAERIYREAGGIGLFVDALDEHAAGYYRRFGFLPSPENPLLLFLPARLISGDPERG
jgi:GNAT superfamily N-acetyltransferase